MRWFGVAGLLMMLALAGCTSDPSRDKIGEQSPAAVNTQLGLGYLQRGLNQEALEKFQKAIRQDSGYAPAHNAIAILYERLGENDKADHHYRRAVSLAPGDSMAQNNYGTFLCRNGRLKEAESHFNKALNDPLYDRPEAAYTNAGICALKEPNPVKAEEYFRQALEKNPRYFPALLEMLKLNYDKGEYLRARAYLQRYEGVARHTPDSLWYGLRVEHELGDRDAVASYGLTLKNKYPDSVQTNALLKWEQEHGDAP